MVRLFFFEYKVKFGHFEFAQSKLVNYNLSIQNRQIRVRFCHCVESARPGRGDFVLAHTDR